MLEAINFNTKIKVAIKKDSKVGYYVFIYDNESGNLLEDWLYDSLDEAFSYAERKHGLSKDKFVEKLVD